MGMLCVQSHDQSTSRGQSTLNRIQTTSRSGLSQTGFKPLWLNAHSCLDSVNANQCALNRIECALSVQCERALTLSFPLSLPFWIVALHLHISAALGTVDRLTPGRATYQSSHAVFAITVETRQHLRLLEMLVAYGARQLLVELLNAQGKQVTAPFCHS